MLSKTNVKHSPLLALHQPLLIKMDLNLLNQQKRTL